MRVVIRDAEWRIRRADDSGDGGYLLTCDGISELVRGKEGLFLTKLEQKVEILDPAKRIWWKMNPPIIRRHSCILKVSYANAYRQTVKSILDIWRRWIPCRFSSILRGWRWHNRASGYSLPTLSVWVKRWKRVFWFRN